MAIDVQIHPSGALALSGDGPDFTRLFPEFCRGAGHALFALLRGDPIPDAGAGYVYFRAFARDFALGVIRSGAEKTPYFELAPGESEKRLAALPPDIRGAANLTAERIEGLYGELNDALAKLAGDLALSAADTIRSFHPNWKDLGKVAFHLAENKKDASLSHPFVFLAACQHRVSETDQVRHIPLGAALKTYADDPAALLSFLTPIKAAAAKNEFIASLVDSGRIFKPGFFTASEAYGFLNAFDVCREEGIPVRVAGLWKNRPKRLKMELTLDIGKKRGLLAAESLVRFSVGATLGDVRLSEAELADILRSPGGLIRVKGEWVEAETGRVSELLKQWRNAAAFAGGNELALPYALRLFAGANIHAGDVPELDADLCAVNAAPAFSEALRNLLDPEKMTLPPLPGTLDGLLRPYQKTGVKFLWNMLNAGFGVCLADDMGLGKTIQLLACFELLRQNGAFDARAALVVAPASLLTNWADEIHKFTPALRVKILHSSALTADEKREFESDPDSLLTHCDVAVTTYAMIARWKKLRNIEFPALVLDEAQQIKNASSQVSRAARSLHSSRRVAMTGTPVENSLSDLWSIFDFIAPGLLGKPDAFREFVRRMESAKPHPDYSPLRRLVRPYILHRLKSDKTIISDLPDKIERKEKTALTPVQAKFYRRTVDAMKAELAAATEETRNGVVLSYLLQFKQICDHPSLFSGNGDFPPEKSGKFQRLGMIAETVAAAGEKMLVFTQFRELTEILHEFLTEKFGRPGLILHGGTPVVKRAEYVKLFQTEQGPPFFVISLKAGGTGLNLTAATQVVHFDRWWNPAVENQATDRAYRIGQKKAVLVHKFISPGTIEEKIDSLIAGKRRLASDLLEQGSAKLLTEMSNEELLAFVQLDIHDEEEAEI